jgi:hypothetical protein
VEANLNPRPKILDRALLIGALLALPALAYLLLVFTTGRKRPRLLPQPDTGFHFFLHARSPRREVASLPDVEQLEMKDGELHLKWDALRERALHLDPVVESMSGRWEHVTDFQIELQPSGPDPAKLRWSPVPVTEVRYVVEISRDKNFRRKVSRYPAIEPLHVATERPGTYYWRVTAMKGAESVASATGRFTLIRTHTRKRKSGR